MPTHRHTKPFMMWAKRSLCGYIISLQWNNTYMPTHRHTKSFMMWAYVKPLRKTALKHELMVRFYVEIKPLICLRLKCDRLAPFLRVCRAFITIMYPNHVCRPWTHISGWPYDNRIWRRWSNIGETFSNLFSVGSILVSEMINLSMYMYIEQTGN